ncbi:deoxyguanosinetriphosphate triphosphohydrolase [Oxalobacter formigenes]|nr:deoxyguanosinetriphosphate triphosphohydrolase [Oxalobacter formigenes]ARQ46377.1 Deoxyguanosinetriphosphate triphosphohydrolase [Oxalobacter formigenes]WAW00876.1 deoxyguanosinetriphosphate triphosphohydrolase [Oxalobacter formigenes]WAW03206.1 deoxyguanosinetriphosphate triphosphohydrolase [Oxalobacter formigenes]WAW06356.1 deoxyguanosinetriphosphate triphosphohydrolase [Oxalobacter formigenes]WAW07258.1 deoxyguanosinetriphosphate triphosphohydrolase [Oxalobacter formigenes]
MEKLPFPETNTVQKDKHMSENMTRTKKEQWAKLLAPIRHGMTDPAKVHFDRARSPYLADYDRILFSNSFRTLARKTQVHPFSANDHVHNRQMHSLEVSSAGRSLGIMVGFFLEERGELPESISPENIGEIVQAACLAHDIGNPPFGHGGESALQDWFKNAENNEAFLKGLTERQKADFKTFDGNAQGFRVVTAIENYKDNGGLRLTYPTLASLVKYPRSAYDAIGEASTKFNFYQSEKQTFDTVFTALGLKHGHYRRHPLSYLTEAADDICYRIIDMEDALELNIISLQDIKDVLAPVYPKLRINEKRLESMDSDRRRAGLIRAKLIAFMIDAIFTAFKNNYDALLDGEPVKSLIDCAEEDVNEYMTRAKDHFFNVILKNHSKIALEIGSYTLYKRLLDTFIPAVHQLKTGKEISYREQQAITLMGVCAPREEDDLYTAYIRVMDFITGMTDTKATFLSRQLLGTTEN